MKKTIATTIIFLASGLCNTAFSQDINATGSLLMNFSVLSQRPSISALEASYLPDSTRFLNGIPFPSQFLTQDFGFLTIKQKTLDEIENDFIGMGVTEKERGQNYVRIVSNKGWDITFDTTPQFHHGLVAMSLEFNANSFEEIQAMSLEFRKDLASKGLTLEYMIGNPYYDEELYISTKINPYSDTQSVVTDFYGNIYSKMKNAIAIVPNLETYGSQFNDTLINWIKRMKPQWFAMTLLSPEDQQYFDLYISSNSRSSEGEIAEKIIIDRLRQRYNFFNKEDLYKTNIVKTMRVLRDMKVKVICLGDGISKGEIRTNLTSYGDAVRNLEWATMMPTTGRGMMLLMPSSVSIRHPYNVQDFIKLRNPTMSFYSVTPFVYFKASDLNARNLSPLYNDEEQHQKNLQIDVQQKHN